MEYVKDLTAEEQLILLAIRSDSNLLADLLANMQEGVKDQKED